jgi:hypothetical protein
MTFARRHPEITFNLGAHSRATSKLGEVDIDIR